jgi:hypothetical protein
MLGACLRGRSASKTLPDWPKPSFAARPPSEVPVRHKPPVCRQFDETERAGFEPAMEFDPHTRLAGECLQPLGHLSWEPACQCRACRRVPNDCLASEGAAEGWQSG